MITNQQEIKQDNEKDIFKKRKAIFLTFNPDKYSIYSFYDLNFKDKLYLFCLLNCGIKNKDLKSIKSLDLIYDSGMKFSATKFMDKKILQHLYQKKIILVDPENSDLSAFDMDSYASFNFEKVSWTTNIRTILYEKGIDNKRLAIMLAEDICKIELKDKIAFYEVLYEIMVEELIYIIEAKCFEFNMPFVFADKIREIFYSQLRDFSAEEINFFINKSVETAHLFYNVGYFRNREFSANIIPLKISNDCDVFKNRINIISKHCSEPEFSKSMITNFFHDYVLHGDVEFFKMSLEKYWNKKIIPVYFS